MTNKKIDFTKLSNAEIKALASEMNAEIARRNQKNQMVGAQRLVQKAFDDGTLVSDISDCVTMYWNDKFMEAAQEFLVNAVTGKAAKVKVQKVFDDAGNLSNTRDELDRGKLTEQEEEEYEQECTEFIHDLATLVGRLKQK